MAIFVLVMGVAFYCKKYGCNFNGSIKSKCLLALLLFSFVFSTQAQYNLKIVSPELEKLNYKNNFDNLETATAYLKELRLTLIEEGYLLASFDTLHAKDTLFASLTNCKKYDWTYLSRGNAEEEILNRINFRDNIYQNTKFSPAKLGSLMFNILQYCENNGHPFASVKLDSVAIIDNHINAALQLNKGEQVTIDSIIIKGTNTANSIYLQNYLQIKKGMLYNESLFKSIKQRIAEIPFLTEAKTTEILFTKNKAYIYLYLENKKANTFNGILGVLPDNATGKIKLTGDLDLKLINALKRGESIELNWRRLETATQNLNAKFSYPFLFNTSFGIETGISIYRRDSTFSESKLQLGIQYLLPGNSFFKVYTERYASNLLSAAVFDPQNYADVKTNLYGIGIKKEKTDYKLNPRKGYFIDLNAGIGKKEIFKNEEVDESFYENLTLNSPQYNLTFNGFLHLQIAKKSTIKFGIKSSFIYNESMFLNELSRIGGLRTIRGFDEESISASSFAICTVEYRFLAEKNSNFFAFFDQGFYETKTVDSFVTDIPYGFGVGTNFQSGAGIFSVTYALGKQFNNPILFRSGKIHFGFTNFF
jgi:outer membrane protein assembly factor BamA